MLITLMLMIALAAIALLAVLPDMKQQIQRNQEEEMCHRGTEYMRAIQHFYKKFGRYPTRIEELENTNNIRFLRKRFKDPLAHDQQGKEKDFKLLHMQDISMNNGPMLGGMMSQMGGVNPAQLQQNPNGLAGAAQQIMNQVQAQGGSLGNSPGKDADAEETGNAPENGGSSQAGGLDASSGPGASGGPGFNTGSTTGNGLNNTVFGGGPILGVASTSKSKTIREYNKKNHYNDWIFVYDPTNDRGGLLVGPWQMPQSSSVMPGAVPAGQLTPGAQQPQSLGTPMGQSQSPQPQQSPQN